MEKCADFLRYLEWSRRGCNDCIYWIRSVGNRIFGVARGVRVRGVPRQTPSRKGATVGGRAPARTQSNQ